MKQILLFYLDLLNLIQIDLNVPDLVNNIQANTPYNLLYLFERHPLV